MIRYWIGPKKRCWIMYVVAGKGGVGGYDITRSRRSKGTYGVESAETLVLDDAGGDGDGTTGGAELEAHL